jgi:hypothetical protein
MCYARAAVYLKYACLVEWSTFSATSRRNIHYTLRFEWLREVLNFQTHVIVKLSTFGEVMLLWTTLQWTWHNEHFFVIFTFLFLIFLILRLFLTLRLLRVSLSFSILSIHLIHLPPFYLATVFFFHLYSSSIVFLLHFLFSFHLSHSVTSISFRILLLFLLLFFLLFIISSPFFFLHLLFLLPSSSSGSSAARFRPFDLSRS